MTALLVVLIERQPAPCAHLRVATLSMKPRNAYELLRLLDRGTVGRLTLLVSEFFRQHHTGVCADLIGELAGRSPCHRFGSARSHAKVVCLDFGAGGKMVLEGSANLRTNSNQEQACLLYYAALHDWHAEWIDATVGHGQGDESDGGETG